MIETVFEGPLLPHHSKLIYWFEDRIGCLRLLCRFIRNLLGIFDNSLCTPANVASEIHYLQNDQISFTAKPRDGMHSNDRFGTASCNPGVD